AVLAELGEAQIRLGQSKEALDTYNAVDTLLIVPEENIRAYLATTLSALKAEDEQAARRNAGILGNLLKVDPTYRQSRDALGDPSQQHPPLYRFKTAPGDLAHTMAESLIEMRYSDVTEEVFPEQPTIDMGDVRDLNLVDFNLDGRLDIAWVDAAGIHLHANDASGMADVTSAAGLATISGIRRSAFADIDNDGDLDLYLNRTGRDAFYRNDDGVFSAIRYTPFPNRPDGIPVDAQFSDIDHDGDLDLLLAEGDDFRFYRNVDAGVFEEATESTGISVTSPANSRRTTVPGPKKQEQSNAVVNYHGGKTIQDEFTDILSVESIKDMLNFGQRMAIADFDLDGALDVLLTVSENSIRLFRNVRQGRFIDWTDRMGIQDLHGNQLVLSGDFNNDGAPDLLLFGETPILLFNQKGSFFDHRNTPAALSDALSSIVVSDGAVLDFDNDGFTDLIVSGTGGIERSGLWLIRNLGENRFEDATVLMPQIASSGILDAGDLDGDGDIDLVWIDSEVRVLRNDGGNINRWLKVELNAALRGSGKNNFYGVGATIELNTETHYQSRLVTSPVTHLGVGSYDQADVMRVTWPNGVPQNRITPETSARIVEEQRLKGSCPSLYTWDGEKYVFVTHLMTRSAIGALSETGTSAYPDAAADYVKIRSDQLKSRDGKFTLRVVEELWDAVYMDTAQLLVVDHPESTEILVNEIYVPPPYPGFELLMATTHRLPRSAIDHHGHDILPHLTARDSLYAGDYSQGTYQGNAETHAITLDLGDLSRTSDIALYLCGWIMPIEPSSNLALSQIPDAKVIPPYLEVQDENGVWQTVIGYTGFPSGEHKTIAIDLTGKFLTDDYRVRITTNLELYWSEAFFTVDEPADMPQTITRLTPERADLHYRGYSQEYRVTSNGPFLRDYSVVSTAPQWLPFEGYRTRYGDVTSLFQATDNRYVIFSSGEEVTLTFDASALPDLPEGWARDYVLHTDGWLKEGDLNTVTAATIAPLPFHGMSDYPYGSDEHYPVTPDIRAYQKVYNTRWVSQAAFRREIRRYGDGLAGLGNGKK
ncbi:MAG: CRTAC1 family protein, partial [Gemmatimonadota bacterium]|nr:CRTAC1 family protein [Gemmatimonadota bacterium]